MLLPGWSRANGPVSVGRTAHAFSGSVPCKPRSEWKRASIFAPPRDERNETGAEMFLQHRKNGVISAR